MSERLQIPGPDDRAIEALLEGDPDGFPLLFHGGAPSAVAEYSVLDEIAGDLGLRLITYSRPGYGASTPRPAPGRMVDDVTDSLAVLDHLGVAEFLTFGWSAGGPRALGCAALVPGRCRAAATVAGTAPIDAAGLDWFDGMVEENHEEYAAAKEGLDAHEAYIVEHMTPMLAATSDELEEALGGMATPVDAAVLTAEFADWVSRSFNNAGAQGPTGIRDDGVALFNPWGFDPAGIAVPVALWHGTEDAFVPYSHGEWLAAAVPGAEAHLFEGEGHLTLMHRLDEVLAHLKRLGGV